MGDAMNGYCGAKYTLPDETDSGGVTVRIWTGRGRKSESSVWTRTRGKYSRWSGGWRARRENNERRVEKRRGLSMSEKQTYRGKRRIKWNERNEATLRLFAKIIHIHPFPINGTFLTMWPIISIRRTNFFILSNENYSTFLFDPYWSYESVSIFELARRRSKLSFEMSRNTKKKKIVYNVWT